VNTGCADDLIPLRSPGSPPSTNQVDPAFDDDVTQDSSHDQYGQRRKEQIVNANVWKPDEGGLHQLATSHENQVTLHAHAGFISKSVFFKPYSGKIGASCRLEP
jgi:hypothetical protein